jgi:hypothetical protein
LKYFIFYKTTYFKSGKYYYGSHHGYLNDKYRGSNKVIKNIQRKSGNIFLKRENLRIFDSREKMLEFEDRFLKLYNLANDKMSYNFKNTANGGDTWAHLTENEKNIRKHKLSKKISGIGNGNYGKNMPQDRKDKMIKTKTGVPIHTEEHKRLTSIRMKNEWKNGLRVLSENFKASNNNRKGKKNTKDTNIKISVGLKNSENHKQGRLSAAVTRRKNYIKRLIEFNDLLNQNKTKAEIVLYFNIKNSTFNKYKSDYKKLIKNE